MVVLREREELRNGQRRFRESIVSTLRRQRLMRFGHRGRTFEDIVFENDELWYFSSENDESRYWNAFGLRLPERSSNIIVEINFPIEEINRRISGVLARTDTDSIKVLHQGGIGGGRRGIGKRSFLDWCRRNIPSRFAIVNEGSTQSECILIATIDDSSFIDDLIEFVRTVCEFKESRFRGETAI